MRSFYSGVVLSLAFTLSSCGTFVPGLEDSGDPRAQEIMVQGIVHNINCEIRDSFYKFHSDFPRSFLDDWTVEVLLSLDVTDKSTVSPSSTLTPTPASLLTFTLAGGISGSSQAVRNDKFHNLFPVQNIFRAGPCDADARPGGPMLLQNDLKLHEWLRDMATLQATHQADFSQSGTPADALYHEVSFEVDTSGSLTPAFKLKQVNYNQGGTFFSTSRNRVHDLQVTLGPSQSAGAGKGKTGAAVSGGAQAAANLALAGQIGRAVADAVKSAISQ